MANRILVTEDDADINRLLTDLLVREGYEPVSAYSGSEARLLLGQESFDLILLDLMLPGMSGEELIAQIRQKSTVPIIVLSAKGREDKYQVLRMGADDFIAKPFDLEEVAIRVEVQLRRCRGFSAKEGGGVLRFKALSLDLENLSAEVKGTPLSLTAREMGILTLLMRYPKKVFTRQNLFETVWNDSYMGDENTINVHISNLRAKIAKLDPGEEYIKTVWGIGFKLADAKPAEGKT